MKKTILMSALARAERIGLHVRREHRSNGFAAPITTVTVIHWTDEACDVLVEREFASGDATAQAECINKTCDIMELLEVKIEPI